MSRLIAAATILMALGASQDRPPGAVLLAVRFTLTDLDNKPIPNASVRLVFGSDKNWQDASTGHSFVTDAKGEHTFTTKVVVDRQMKQKPTNYKDSLTTPPQPMDHLLVGAELEYATFRWLYALDIFHIPPGGDTMLDGQAIWTRDAKGNFTRPAKHDRDGWHMPELGGLVLTAPGYEVSSFTLRPSEIDPSSNPWTLNLGFKRHPPPIRR